MPMTLPLHVGLQYAGAVSGREASSARRGMGALQPGGELGY